MPELDGVSLWLFSVGGNERHQIYRTGPRLTSIEIDRASLSSFQEGNPLSHKGLERCGCLCGDWPHSGFLPARDPTGFDSDSSPRFSSHKNYPSNEEHLHTSRNVGGKAGRGKVLIRPLLPASGCDCLSSRVSANRSQDRAGIQNHPAFAE